MYAHPNNRRRGIQNRRGTVGDGVPNDGPIIPGYCACGRPAGRTGRCATCDANDRRSARRIETDSNKVQPRKSIRPRSKKQAALEAQYSRDRAEWLPGKKCAVFKHMDATEIHHKKGRRGYANEEKRRLGIPLLLDKDHWLPVSEKGHKEITNKSAWAFRMGFTELRSNQSK